MFFPFECKNCRKDKWTIRFDSENKSHVIQCANCGEIEILEEIFGNSRRKKNASKADYKRKLIGENKKSYEAEKVESTGEQVK